MGREGFSVAGRGGLVDRVGRSGEVNWTQDERDLAVRMPRQRPSDHANCLKVFGAWRKFEPGHAHTRPSPVKRSG